MALILIGTKKGMTQIFDKNGHVITGTAIALEPNVVTQVKTKENDGYNAIQLGSIVKKKNVLKPQKGFFAKIGQEPRKHLKETRVEDVAGFTVGQEIGVDYFAEGDWVDVAGVSKGKGYQGVMKLHRFRGGPAAHGSGFHRHAGSTGMRTTPGRCFPGGKRASHMGAEKKTAQSLQVICVDKERQLLIVTGAIPGFSGNKVYVSFAKKKTNKRK